MSIEVRKSIPNGNEAWPLEIKVTDHDVHIYHDAQRDRDGVHLSLDEWAAVRGAITQALEAIKKAAAVLSEEMKELEA